MHRWGSAGETTSPEDKQGMGMGGKDGGRRKGVGGRRMGGMGKLGKKRL